MSKPILRVGKIKKFGASTLQSVDGHLTRSRPTPNADAKRTKDNRVLHGDASQSLSAAVHAVYAKYGIDPASLKKDATVANDIVISISPEWFRPDDPDRAGHYDPDRLRVFEAEAMQLLKKRFNGGRLVRVDLHLDEATPHIHAIVVPVLKKPDGNGFRLSGKDMFNPRSLAAMQQDWQDAMTAHGVGERLKRSTAKHRKLKEYYSAVEADTTVSDLYKTLDNVTVTPPPAKGWTESAEAYKERAAAHIKAEQKRVRDELRPYVAEAAKGRLFEAERLTAQAARSHASQSDARFYEQAEKLAALHDELALTKDEVKSLRELPIRRVAEALEHDGPIGTRENAIDLVKRVTGLDFKASVAWLHQALGQEAMTAALTAVMAPQTPATAIWTKADYVKRDAMRDQLGALDAESYRVTFFRESGAGWKFKQGDKESFTKDELLELVPEISREATSRGANVYVTPLSNTQHFVLLDDVTNDDLRDFKAKGYTPAIVQESSPANNQVVLRFARAGLRNEKIVNEFFKDLNRAYGDDRITGLHHPFRLAGFMNRKEKHFDPEAKTYPFVKLKEAVNQSCKKSVEALKVYGQKLQSKFGDLDAIREKINQSRRDKSRTTSATYKP